jgi:hypothetical protein
MTLTYIYSESRATLGSISTFAEPHAYDLCDRHSQKLTVPHGWEFIREEASEKNVGPSDDDLMAIADAVREAAMQNIQSAPEATVTHNSTIGRRGHLRAVPD